jgi:hypothetical protein
MNPTLSICHVSYVMCHVSYVMCHISCVRCQVSYVIYNVSHVICQVSYVMCRVRCHVSCVICQVSYMLGTRSYIFFIIRLCLIREGRTLFWAKKNSKIGFPSAWLHNKRFTLLVYNIILMYLNCFIVGLICTIVSK